jgi:CRISPR-associated protein Csa2
MYVSISARLLANAEALNMVESIGNVARHRRVPIVVPRTDGYTLIYAPAVSGECLANAYQQWLANLAEDKKLPVCGCCQQRLFIKHGDLEAIKLAKKPWEDELIEKKVKESEKVEKLIVQNCVVEDIGGFLLPEEIPAKRTSKFRVSFMVPAFDAIEQLALESQFQVRYAPEPAMHRIYYVEVGSVLYVFQMGLELDEIGRLTMVSKEYIVSREERTKRVEIALEALAHMLENKIFGARLARTNPVSEVRSLMVTVSHPLPFQVSPPHSRDYMKDTFDRARDFAKLIGNEKIKLWAFDREGACEGMEGIEKCNTISSVFFEVLNYFRQSSK